MRASTLLETSLVILRCAQYVSYDKTMLIGNGHTSAPLRQDGPPARRAFHAASIGADDR